MNPLDGLRMLAGARRAEGSPVRRATNVSMTQMEAVADSSDGTVMVDPGGMVISGDGSQYVEVPVIGNVRKGDTVSVALVGDDGTAKAMQAIGTPGGGDRQQEAIDAAAAATTLEAPYTEVEWVESQGNQVVQLDWVPNKDGSWGFDVDFLTYSAFVVNGNAFGKTREDGEGLCGTIFGVRHTATSNRDYELITSSQDSSTGGLRFGSNKKVSAGLLKDQSRQQCSLRNGVYTKPDGTTTAAASVEGIYPNWGMCVFATETGANWGAKYENPSITRLYSLRFYDGDDLAVDLVGAVRKSDGLTGLWDRVEGRFWPAAGMTYGDEVGDLGDAGTLAAQSLAHNPAVTDTKTEASRLWTADAPTIAALEDGQQVTLRLRYPTETPASGSEQEAYEAAQLANRADSGRSNNVYLRLTLADGSVTDWVPCYYGAATRLTTHYGVGNDIRLVYHEDQVFGTTVVPRGWWADANYYNNTNNYDRRLHNDNVKAAVAIATGHLICGDADGYQHVAAGVSFDLAYPVLYASAAIKLNANGKTAYEAIPAVNFSTSGTITGGAAAATIWLRGTVSGNTFTVANDGSPYLTCVTPTTRDGFCYIPLGLMTSATAGYFATSSQLYAFLGGYFGPRSIREVCRYVTELTDGIMVHPEGDETSGWSIREALELLKGGVSYIKAWLDNDVPSVRIGREDTGNLLIDDDSVDVRSGISTLATFAASLIELGKNSVNSVIKMCDGTGTISVDSGGSFTMSYGTPSQTTPQIGLNGGWPGGVGDLAEMTVAQVTNEGESRATVAVTGENDGCTVHIDGLRIQGSMGGTVGLIRPIGIYTVTMTTPANDGADATIYFGSGPGDITVTDTDYVVILTPEGQPNGFTHIEYVVSAKYVNGFKIHSYNDWTSAITQTVVAVVMHK